jgi:hypothetical protein
VNSQFYLPYVIVESSGSNVSELIQGFRALKVSFESSVKEIPKATAELLLDRPAAMKASEAGSDHYKKLVWTNFSLDSTERLTLVQHPEYPPTIEEVKTFTNIIKEYYEAGNKSEIANVQAPSSVLISNLVPIFFEGTDACLRREFDYDGIIVEGSSKNFDVRGKIDVAIVVGNPIETTIFALENKAMNVVLQNKDPNGLCARGLCQLAYNLKCIHRKYQISHSTSIPHIIGALTNGLQWIFVSLDSTSGKPTFSRTLVIDTVSRDGASIDETSIRVVAEYLVKALLSIKKHLASAQQLATPAGTVDVPAAGAGNPISAGKFLNQSLQPSKRGKSNASSAKSAAKDSLFSGTSELNKENLFKLLLSQRNLGNY